MKPALRAAGLLLAFLTLHAAAEELQLQQVVLVSRHGVRSPTDLKPPLAQLAADPWPKWSIGPGELTPHGARLATLMGAYYREAFADDGLLKHEGCARPNDLFVWSDTEDRTRASAQAMMDGMYPGCGLKPATQPNLKKDDPLFHPTTAGVCELDGATARNAILGRTGGDLNALMAAYAEPFAKLQSVLKCCAPQLCASNSASCTLSQLPATISPEGRLQGPIPIASSITEVFQLEYANALPQEQVAWGRADEATLRYLSQLHTLQYDLSQRTLYPAQRQGSNLMDQVLGTLRGKITGKRLADSRAPAASKVVMFVGHDVNIANLGGMLNVDWVLEGYQPNDLPPGGALAFQLYRGKTTGRHYVSLFYYAQTPAQLRQGSVVDVMHPPTRAEIALPGCAADLTRADTATLACPWNTFERLAGSAIDRKCVGRGMPAAKKKPLESM